MNIFNKFLSEATIKYVHNNKKINIVFMENSSVQHNDVWR